MYLNFRVRPLTCLLVLIPLFLFVAAASSQEIVSTNSVLDSEYAHLSDAELLRKAESLEFSDPQLSTQLANFSLKLSIENKHKLLTAEAHYLLAGIAEDAKNYKLSLPHFLQALNIYKELDDKLNQIIISLNYADVLIDAKQYNDSLTIMVELLPIALEYNNEILLGRTFMLTGDAYYKIKRYDNAIAQYTEAVKHFSDEDDLTYKYLGDTYKRLAQAYNRKKNRQKTAYFFKKALTVYENLERPKLMARILKPLAEAERYMGNYVVALEYSLRGLELHKLLDDPDGLAQSQSGAGIIYRYIGLYEQSIKSFLKANNYYKEVNDVNGIAKTSNQMGLIYTRLKQFEQARSFYQLVIDQSENDVDLNTRAAAYRELAVIDLNNKNYESAKVMAQKALNIYHLENEKEKESIVTRILGNIYRDEGNKANAILFYSKSLALATEVGSKEYQARAQTPLANILMDEDVDKSIRLLTSSLTMATAANNKYQQLYAIRYLVQAEKIKGNLAKALGYSEEETKLVISIQDNKEEQQLATEKASLYAHKMEIELESLRKKAKLDQLEIVRKNNEIEIVEQAKVISDLNLIKNRYTNIALASLLAICIAIVVFIYRRFSDSKKRNKELDYLAARDPLTNCYNRRILFNFMSRDFSDLDSLNEYSVLMVDVDHFKDVNDTFGHSTGDEVLRGVVDILQSIVRKADTVARYGGEEFCVVLPTANLEKAMEIAEKIRESVEKNAIKGVNITCSIGVSSIKFHATSVSEILEQADIALYKSKALGRNRVTVWNKSFT